MYNFFFFLARLVLVASLFNTVDDMDEERAKLREDKVWSQRQDVYRETRCQMFHHHATGLFY